MPLHKQEKAQRPKQIRFREGLDLRPILKKVDFKTEETDEWIHLPVVDKSNFDPETFTVIEMPEPHRITSIQGNYPGEKERIVLRLMFDKSLGWTMETAKEWARENNYFPQSIWTGPLDGRVVPQRSAPLEFKNVDLKNRKIEGFISTDDLDCYRDIVVSTAFETAIPAFMRNPMVCYMHDWYQAIGKALELEIQEKGLFGSVYISETAETIWKLIEEGILKAFSYSYDFPNGDADWTMHGDVRVITNLELLEISVVTIPANSFALFEQAKSKSIVIPAPYDHIRLFGERRTEPEKKEKPDGGSDPSEQGKSQPIKVEVKSMPPKDDDKFTGDAAWKRSVDDGLKMIGEIKPELERLKDGPSKADWEEFKAKAGEDMIEHAKSINRETRRLEFQSFREKDPYFNQPALQHPFMYLKKKPAERYSMLLGLPTADPQAKAVQMAADDLLITHMIMKRHGENYGGIKSLAMYDRYMEVSEDFRKAMDTATATEGLEWIPTELSADLVDQIRLELRVASLFQRFWMPTPVFKFPVKTGGFVVYYLSEATADVDEKIPTSGIPTADVTFTARKLGGRLLSSTELSEDSIVAVLPLIKADIVKGLADGQEDVIINGDRSAPHQDAKAGDPLGVNDAKDRRKAFAGLRELCPATTFRDVTTYDVADLRTLRGLMGKYGVDPKKLCHIMSIGAYMTTLSFTEVATVDKFGEQATWLKGYLSAIDGIPIEISEYVRADLNASGVYDGVTKTKTLTLLVRKDAYLIGDRRMPRVKSAQNIETDQDVTVVTQRMDFEGKYAATELTVGVNYNV